MTPVRAAQHGSAPVRRCSCGGIVGPTGECASCRQKRVQREAARGAATHAPPIVHDVLRSAGKPLEPGVRARMEERFQHDFSRVRIHSDTRAGESARAVAANAYTVGEHVAFAPGRYSPGTAAGDRLLAHELAHVRQQAPRGSGVPQRLPVAAPGSALEHEADAAAASVASDRPARVAGRVAAGALHRHPEDIVGYSGGQSGRIIVLRAGSLVYYGPAVSGHPGGSEWEPNIGPTPTGMYHITPGVTQAPVTHLMDGVCGAPYTALGYQEIPCTDPVPCEAGSHHYCNVPCPTPSDPGQLCWTPRDCWGSMRIRIEGGADVLKPTGGKVRRDGFYLHGGNPLDPISSGCVKSMNDSVFGVVRTLTGTGGRVRFCVGSACPPPVIAAFTVTAAINAFVGGATSGAAAEASAGAAVLQRDLATELPAVAPPAQEDLTDDQIQAAIAFNRARYDAANTRLIQNLLGGPVTGTWSEANIVAIAQTQEQYGLTKDGKVGHDTFVFLNREERLERLSASNENCLVSFRLIPDTQAFRRVNPTKCHVRGHFQMQAEFSPRCNCAQFQYRQFIRGHFTRTRGGTTEDIGDAFSELPAGRINAAFQEDGDTTDVPVNYGHRDEPPDDQPVDHYFDDPTTDNQATGCRYEGEDAPGGDVDDCLPGDSYDIEVSFRGEIQRNGSPVQTKFWTAIRRANWRP